MIVDTSALVAIMRAEADAARFAATLAATAARRMSAASYLETAIVIDAGRDPIASREVDVFIHRWGIEIAAVTIEHARIARQAYRDYGKGSGHPAKLNFGDCFAYALAYDTGEPLLFKGDDFAHTDLTPA